MKHVLSRAGGSATLLLAVLTASSGCTEEDTGLFIAGNVLLEAPDCVVTAEANATRLLSGTLDVALRLDYEATLLVGNQLTSRSEKENLRTETSITTITGAEVQLLTDTGEVVTEFTVPASGVIAPDSSEDPGFGIVLATLIPAATGAALADELEPGQSRTRVARAKVFGATLGGVDVESAEFTYVIGVCEGCLVSFPPEALDANGNCNQPTDQEIEAPCRFGQDAPVDCRLTSVF